MQRNVVIHVVKDPVPLGENCRYFQKPDPQQKVSPNCADQRKLVSEIKQKGSFDAFDKPKLCGKPGSHPMKCFEHGKIVIIDRSYSAKRLALISTGNFNSSNLCDLAEKPSACNRDYSYVTKDDEVIAGLVKVFTGDIQDQPLQTPPAPKKMTVSPFTR